MSRTEKFFLVAIILCATKLNLSGIPGAVVNISIIAASTYFVMTERK